METESLLRFYFSEQNEDVLAGGRGTGGSRPVVQTAGSQRFLVEHPLKSIQEGRFMHVPLLGGVTRHEGSFILGSKCTKISTRLQFHLIKFSGRKS
jgi:hypothetical protein